MRKTALCLLLLILTSLLFTQCRQKLKYYEPRSGFNTDGGEGEEGDSTRFGEEFDSLQIKRP